jgi:hypothetical protein
MKLLCLILLIFCNGCITFEDSSHDQLIALYTQQAAIIAQQKHQQDIDRAVKNFQIQAIKAGFAYWDVVDYEGKVEFRWVNQKRK